MAENTNTEREAFESALKSLAAKHGETLEARDFGRDSSGEYENGATEIAWALWSARASLSLPAAGQEPVAWTGGEEWEHLAWHLCAEENGEESCGELIWEGGPVPEPWGEWWLKYEGEAKRMIELVRKFAAPQPAVAAGWVSVDERLPEPNVEVLCAGRGFGNAFVTACYYDDERREWYPVNTHWTDATGCAQYPTHWMPLPPAPSTEGDRNG